ncbi:MAG: GntR family transcriptional regulator [Clostridiales bacterium]|nr:GntR family transcriptional regulator [Clostridiales bacterium]
MKYKPSVPVYIQIKDDIIEKIRQGKWQENQKISSEQQLIAEYNVGRGTVREAIKLVIDEGYLYIKKGVGTFVSQKDVGISIEPFVSLTYFIKMRGLQLITTILKEEEMTVTKELSEFTGLEQNSKCLFVKRVRVLEGNPIAIEEFYFSDKSFEYLKDYDFTKGISHYLFEDHKIEVGKMSMDFEVLQLTEEVKDLLKLEAKTKMIKSCRTVRMNPGNEILYFLQFYCGEKLSRIGINGFV